MTSFIQRWNAYFSSHHEVFLTYMFVTLGVLTLLFVITFIHVLRGVRYTFVVAINFAIIQSMICYIVFVN